MSRKRRPRSGQNDAVEHVADVDRVVVLARDRPQRLHAGGDPPQRARGAPDRLRAAVEQHRVGQRLVLRRALGVQRREALAVARQRPALAARAAPGRGLVDVEHHDRVPRQQLAHARGADRAAAERDHRRRNGVSSTSATTSSSASRNARSPWEAK